MALADGRIESFEQPHYAAWIIEREAGGLVAGFGRDIVRIDLDTDMRAAIVSVDPRNAGNRLNDAKADAMGRIWAGTMPVTFYPPAGAFSRLDPHCPLTQVCGPYTLANGPAIHPDTDMREAIGSGDPRNAGNRWNEAKADAMGRSWAVTMPVTCDRPSCAFYRLDPDGTLTQVGGPYTIANGPAIDPDGAFLLHTDTARGTIFRFDIHDDGSLGEAMPFIVFEEDWGNPDGMTFDAEGGLWVACWGASRVMRSEEHTSELQSLMRISYAVFCLKKK